MKLPKNDVVCNTITNTKEKVYVITRTLDGSYVLYKEVAKNDYEKISKKDSPLKLEKLIPDFNSEKRG